MNAKTVETLFGLIDESTESIKIALDISYLEALIETGDNLFESQVLQDEFDEQLKTKLMNSITAFQETEYEKESIRRAFQLAILKGMKEGIQPNHEMTPDGIGFIMSYLVSKFTKGKNELKILDPAVGTGNLLHSVLIQTGDKFSAAYGVDVDDILVRLAYVVGNLLGHEIELFNQDSLGPLLIDPVDLVVCDLPVGYFPNEERAKNYKLKAKEGMSYSHHLFIEQSMNYLKNGGYFIGLIPNHLFTSEQAPQLHEFIKETCMIQGLIQLPASTFKEERHQKSILILRKNAEDNKKLKQALLVDFPKLTNSQAVEEMMYRINKWFEENL
jgi:site-specific DNA-methyltransferase (adenine-specific)